MTDNERLIARAIARRLKKLGVPADIDARIASAGSTTASLVTFSNPVVATIWGVLLLGETLHWYEPLGAVVVILGAYLAQRR